MAETQQAAAPMEPQIGVWDQFCVLNDRPYSKEGVQSLLNDEHCREILANFRLSKDDLPANISHDKDRVVGFYNALALVVGGTAVDFATHDPTVAPPMQDELPGGDDGSPPDDGLYWRRCRLTDLGRGAKQYLRKVSPEFFSEGKNEFGDPIGYQAVGGAWTNYPFLQGCELNEFERETRKGLPMAKKMSYAARCYEDAGCGKDDDDKVKFAKVSAYWRGKHGAEFAKYAEDAGVGKDDDESTQMTKMMSYMAGKFGDLEIKHKDDDGQEMTGPSVSGTAPPVVDGGEPNKDEVPGAGGQMTREFERFARELGLPTNPAAARARVQSYETAAQALPQLERQVQALAAGEKERQKQMLRSEAQEFTATAWRAGRIRPRADEKHSDAQARILNLYTKSGKEAAEAALLDAGSYTPPEAMGNVLHFSNDRPAQEMSRPDEEIMRRCAIEMEKNGITPKDKSGRWDYRLGEYAKAICQQDPTLAKRYRNQSRAALMQELA